MQSEVVAHIPSSREKGKTYRIWDEGKGKYSCECWDYIIRRKAAGEDCKHIREYREILKEQKRQARRK